MKFLYKPQLQVKFQRFLAVLKFTNVQNFLYAPVILSKALNPRSLHFLGHRLRKWLRRLRRNGNSQIVMRFYFHKNIFRKVRIARNIFYMSYLLCTTLSSSPPFRSTEVWKYGINEDGGSSTPADSLLSRRFGVVSTRVQFVVASGLSPAFEAVLALHSVFFVN